MIASFLIAVVNLYSIIVVVRVVFSWLGPQARQKELCAFLHAITEPLMRPLRRLIPPLGGIDFSPILLFFALRVMVGLLARLRF